MKQNQHVMMFSQTGEEIYRLIKHFNKFPDIIITNQDQWDKVHLPLRVAIEEEQQRNPNYFNPWRHISTVDRKATSKDYEEIFSELEDPLITLHGWLKIIPPDICQKYKIFNGHPSLITLYPELKGFSPQEKIWEARQKDPNMYSMIGSVVHRVVPEVDAGEVVEVASCVNTASTKDELYATLKDRSFRAWTLFLEDKL